MPKYTMDKRQRASKLAEQEIDTMFERVELKPSPQTKLSPPMRQIVVSIPSGAPVGVEEAIRTTLEGFLLNGKAKSTLIFEHW